MAENWDLYDISRNKLNRFHERGVQLGSGEYHLVVEVWVINSRNQILLTKRHPDKRWGGYWECRCGAVIAGEDSITGAKRELFEEVGIEISNELIVFLGTQQYRDWFTDSFLVRFDVPISNLNLQSSEVINAKWVDINEFEEMSSKELIVQATVDHFYLYAERINLLK